MHLICEKDMFASEKMQTYIERTGQVILEANTSDPAVVQKVAKLSMIEGGKKVKDYLTPEEYSRLDEVYKSYLGISFDALQKFKPLISGTVLLMSPKIMGCQRSVIYDRYLGQMAAAKKLPVTGLESAEEQIAVIDSQPLDQQIKTLNEIGANPQKSINEFQSFYKIYLTQNSDALYEMAVKSFNESGYSQTKMLDQRNINWIPTLEKNMKARPSFIAVGAGHLGGKSGVVKLLRDKGYKLTVVKL